MILLLQGKYLKQNFDCLLQRLIHAASRKLNQSRSKSLQNVLSYNDTLYSFDQLLFLWFCLFLTCFVLFCFVLFVCLFVCFFVIPACDRSRFFTIQYSVLLLESARLCLAQQLSFTYFFLHVICHVLSS